MPNMSFANQQVYGEAILERLARSPHAGALKKEAQAFKAAQSPFSKACDKVVAAQARRDDVIEAIGTADGQLDKALLFLADRLVGAGLGKRQNPFADYSSHSPQKLTALSYAAEEKEARALLTKLGKKKPPVDVAAACKAAAAAADEVKSGLKGLVAPQADYEVAMQARDSLLLDVNKALGRLKRAAAVVYDEDRAGYRALFAPAKELSPPKRRTKKPPPPPKTT